MFHHVPRPVVIGMAKSRDADAVYTAEIIVHLSRLAHGDGLPGGLTAAQWAALRYFSQANRSSRTLAAFADYQVTTRGTASQTITKLVEKGLLTRRASSVDRRSALIDLTPEGLALCSSERFNELVHAISDLPGDLRNDVLAALEALMERIAENRRRRRFGTCESCGHLSVCIDQPAGETGHVCCLTGLPLNRSELDQLCINYQRP